VSDGYFLDLKDYQNIKNGDSVYVVSTVLNKFLKYIFPVLVKNKTRIVLVTGASFLSVPHELGNYHNLNYVTFFQKNRYYFIQWFAQNCQDSCNNLITPIPLGIDYHTLQTREHYWGPKQTAEEQENGLHNVISNFQEKRQEKKIHCFSYFHFAMFNRHGRDRYLAKKQLENSSFNTFLNIRKPRLELWKKCVEYCFIISPHGNGLDCHRTWEAIALGCIPIVRTSNLDTLYDGLPVLIVEKWEDLTHDVLKETVYAFSKKTFNMEKITLNYWKNLISSASDV
jgi:hypothetical protein